MVSFHTSATSKSEENFGRKKKHLRCEKPGGTLGLLRIGHNDYSAAELFASVPVNIDVLDGAVRAELFPEEGFIMTLAQVVDEDRKSAFGVDIINYHEIA